MERHQFFRMIIALTLALLVSMINGLQLHGAYRAMNGLSTSLRMSSSSNELETLCENVRKETEKDSVIVIKYGGHAMENDELRKSFCEDIGALCRLNIIPIIVHGGGPQIEKMLKSLSVESKFIQGLRVTDKRTMEIAQMVLCGSINKDIVSAISVQQGVRGAIGLSGLDSRLVKAKIMEKVITDPVTGEKSKIDLGLVGEPYEVNTSIINDLLKLSLVPVIAPVGLGPDGQSLNVNADTSAGAVAEALKADRLLLLTDIVGVLDKNKTLMTEITSSNFANLVSDGTITGGMIPKVETAVQSVNRGVKAVSIMDGRVKHSVLRALSGEKFGTKIVK